MSGPGVALAFFTPFGRPSAPTPASVDWFPAVGIAIGAAVGAVWWGAGEWWPPAVAAALAVLADVAFTGMLHLDGLADTADGVLPHFGDGDGDGDGVAERNRRLEVMSAPDVGAFGVVVVVVVVLLRWAALASIAPHVLMLAGLWCASRTLMAVVVRSVPYARGNGLATAFLGGGRGAAYRVALIGLVASAALMVVAADDLSIAWGQSLASLAAAIVAGASVITVGRARLGGFTGDVLGAAGVVAETVGLLVMAAAW